MSCRKLLIGTADRAGATALADRIVALGHPRPSVAHTPTDLLVILAAERPSLLVIDAALDPARGAHRLAQLVERFHPAPLVCTVAEGSDAATQSAADELESSGRADMLRAPFTERELRLTLELALCRHDRAHHALDLENRFFAVSIDLLCQLDFNGYFRRLNPAWERTLGFTIEELKSRPFLDFVHPDDRARTLRQNREVRGGGQALGFENRYLCKDGSYRWLLWNAASDADDRAIYSVARDITARKEADDDRERLVSELQTAMAEVKVLQDFLPICSYCRKVRDDEDFWHSVESYVARHTNTRFSHGVCPECLQAHLEPQFAKLRQG